MRTIRVGELPHPLCIYPGDGLLHDGTELAPGYKTVGNASLQRRMDGTPNSYMPILAPKLHFPPDGSSTVADLPRQVCYSR